MLGSDEDSLARDAVHVDASAGLKVVEMDETVFRDKIDNAVLLRDLHRYREIVRSLRWEVDIHSLLREWRIRCGMINLNDVQLVDISSARDFLQMS